MTTSGWMESMSQTRAKRMEACPRQEWWYSVGAVPTWKRASPVAHEAWALRCATSLDAALGSAIHVAAAAHACALRDGRRTPSYDEALAQVRGDLAKLWRATDVDAFRRDPKRNGMLLERLEGREVAEQTLASLRVKIPALVRRLVQHPIWEHVRQCGRGEIVVVEALDAMLVEVDGRPVKLYAAPDLVYIAGDTLELPDFGIPIPAKTPVIVDWKSGRTGDAQFQLALYAGYVRDHLGLAPGPLGYLGRVGELQGMEQDALGGQAMLIGSPEIARARARMDVRVRQLRTWTGPDGRLDRDQMPKDLTGCRFCSFASVCNEAAA